MSGSPFRKFPITAVVVACALIVAAWLVWNALAPSRAQPHIEAGFNLADKSDLAGAQREWRLATEADPANRQAWDLLIASYFETRQWAPARAALERLRRLDPSFPGVNSRLASCAFQQGDLDSAERYAAIELKRDPNDVPALGTAAAVRARKGDSASRLQYLRRLADLRPTELEYQRALAAALYSDRNMTELIPVVERIIHLEPGDSDAWALRGEARLVVDPSPQGLKQAAEDLQRALRLAPGRFTSYLALARIHSRRREWVQAIDSLQQAIRLRPESSEAWYEIAAAWQRQGDITRAEAARARYRKLAEEDDRFIHLKKVCDASSNDFDLHLQAGLLALRRHEDAAARRYLGQASRLRPQDPRAPAALRQLASAPDSNLSAENR